ncbi:MAG: transposase, partial [Candidatus Dadabacteria bacterium]
MPRKPRQHVPGGIYHVIQRGVAQRKIFTRRGDQDKFLDILGEIPARYGHRIHAYCLMNNHVHLAIQSGDQPLGRAMQSLFGRYGQWFNRTRNRSGHLFQDRHRAILVDRDAYLNELIRYIHLNPVRVGAVDRPEEYPWSSHRHYLSGAGPEWLTTDMVLGAFSTQRNAAVAAFQSFVHEGIGQSVQLDFKRGNSRKQAVLAPDGFAEAVMRR